MTGKIKFPDKDVKHAQCELLAVHSQTARVGDGLGLLLSNADGEIRHQCLLF